MNVRVHFFSLGENNFHQFEYSFDPNTFCISCLVYDSQSIYCYSPLQKEMQNESGDALNQIEEWDNKMAKDMLPLDKEAEAFGETPPEAQYDKETSEEQENKENVDTTESTI